MTIEMKNGAITLLDVLGWSGIWQRRSDAIDALERLLDKAEKKIDEHFSSDKDSHKRVIDGLSVEIRSISDTIALVTYGDINKAIAYQSILNSYLISLSIQELIPLRGATSYGQLIIRNNIMVGPAVDEVASWYEMSDTIGVFLTPSALLQIDPKKLRIVPPVLVSEDIKIKGHANFKTLSVNWVSIWRYIFKCDRNELIEHFLEMGPITPNIFSKYISSISFYDSNIDVIEAHMAKKEIAASKEEKYKEIE